MMIKGLLVISLVLTFGWGVCQGQPSADEVKVALLKSSAFFQEQVAVNGGYVYYASPDFSRRLGEGTATATEVWVQAPGTPTVGMAYLSAYGATGDQLHLAGALAAGKALVYGQLESGGWRNSIDFDPAGPRVDRYRNGKGKGKNYSTLDDGITQEALTFLIRLDEVLNFENQEIHEAVEYALPRLLAAQFTNGAFPQVWLGPVNSPDEMPASFPDYDWKTEGRIKEYWDQYTLNDGLAGTVSKLLMEAHRVYKKPEYRGALEKLGHFLMLAQLPAPQRGWAQQYGPNMVPIWARAFEPPGVSGRESEDAMKTLLRIAHYTGDESFMAAVVSGVKYLESSLLPDGRLARYYEMQTNRPLYMERKAKVYTPTFDDSNLPDHYGWKTDPELDSIKAGYRAATKGEDPDRVFDEVMTTEKVQAILESLDFSGRWMSRYEGERLAGQPKFADGEVYINSGVFAGNTEYLSRYLKAFGRN
ncbi:pectate lyase [Verrucomicrobiales bacterium]|nr:pectate lyase [Verrucomicrobiales bacterium]MDA7926448.1 pectate lyase [Verrucomicrobiales bacterium]